VQALHLPQSAFGLLILTIPILEIIENIAPKGHRYLQKNLSINADPIVINIKNINPTSKFEKIVDTSVI
jgi:hypothetical protein